MEGRSTGVNSEGKKGSPITEHLKKCREAFLRRGGGRGGKLFRGIILFSKLWGEGGGFGPKMEKDWSAKIWGTLLRGGGKSREEWCTGGGIRNYGWTRKPCSSGSSVGDAPGGENVALQGGRKSPVLLSVSVRLVVFIRGGLKP